MIQIAFKILITTILLFTFSCTEKKEDKTAENLALLVTLTSVASVVTTKSCDYRTSSSLSNQCWTGSAAGIDAVCTASSGGTPIASCPSGGIGTCTTSGVTITYYSPATVSSSTSTCSTLGGTFR